LAPLKYGGGKPPPPLGYGTYPEPLIPFTDRKTGCLCASSAVLKALQRYVRPGAKSANCDRRQFHSKRQCERPARNLFWKHRDHRGQGTVTFLERLIVWNFELPSSHPNFRCDAVDAPPPGHKNPHPRRWRRALIAQQGYGGTTLRNIFGTRQISVKSAPPSTLPPYSDQLLRHTMVHSFVGPNRAARPNSSETSPSVSGRWLNEC